MKPLITLTSVVLTTFLLIGCSPQRENISNLDERFELFLENGTPIMVEGKPFSGILFQEHSNGRIKLELHLKNGIPNGPFESYHENGQLLWKGTYKDGVKDGSFETYYENGQLREKGTYKDGKKDGRWEIYWEDGTLYTYKSGFYKNGVKVFDLLQFIMDQ